MEQAEASFKAMTVDRFCDLNLKSFIDHRRLDVDSSVALLFVLLVKSMNQETRERSVRAVFVTYFKIICSQWDVVVYVCVEMCKSIGKYSGRH